MNATGSEYGAALSKFEGGEDGNDAASPAKDFEEDISLSVFAFLPSSNVWYCNNIARERVVRFCPPPFRRKKEERKQ